MAHYKIFYLGLAGAIFAAEDVDCADDPEAIGCARARCGERADAFGFEVWQRDRRIHVEKKI